MSNWTNATFATELCSLLSQGPVSVTISSISGKYFAIPSCFSATSASAALVTIQASGIVIPNFSFIPSTVTIISVSNSFIIADPDHSDTDVDGFNTDGSIAWNTEFFSYFPQLTSLTFSNCGLIGSLPTSLPSSLLTFYVPSNALSGSIPSTLFNNFAASPLSAKPLLLNLVDNNLTGSIPSDLFTPLSSSNFSIFAFYANNNKLSGALAPELLTPLGSSTMDSFYFSVSNNQLSGTLPSTSATGFVPPIFHTRTASYIYLQNNTIGGSWPSNFFQNVKTFGNFAFDISNNELSGVLPTSLFPSSNWSPTTNAQLTIMFSNNALSGSVPNTLLTAGLKANATLGTIVIALDSNSLSGSLPDRFWRTETMTVASGDPFFLALSSASGVKFSLGSNLFEGEIPPNMLQGAVSATSLTSTSGGLTLDISGNSGIVGTLPEGLLSPAMSWFSDSGFATLTAGILLGNTNITGSLPSACSSTNRISIQAQNTLINGPFPDSWQSCRFNNIDVSSCSNFNATIPSTLLSSLITFAAANTPLQGDLPSINSPLTSLTLTNDADIDFCNAPSNAAFPSRNFALSVCSFTGTSACSCPQYFPAKCTAKCPATPSPLAPVACSGVAPGEGFTCSGGIWTATSTNSSIITISSGSSPTVVTGNLGSSSIVFQGVGSTVTVEGCANNLTSIHIELSESQAEAIKQLKTLQTLLSQNISGCVDLSNVALSISVKNGGCKKARVSKVVSDGGSTLGGLFTLDTSGCNRWWIILVSVICGVILVAVIVVILVAIFSPRFRTAIRPFSGRKAKEGNVS